MDPAWMFPGAKPPPPVSGRPSDKPFFRKPFLLGAHRGGGDLWPESTLVAFRQAAKRWPNIVLETDARLTADGHVVLMHDENVDRTTNGTGAVSKLTLADIKDLDAGYRFTRDGGQTYPYRGKGVKVATLAEALTALPESRFEIEYKPCNGIVVPTLRVIRQARAEDRVLMASFDPRLMAESRRLKPNIATCYELVGGMELLKALRGDRWNAYRPTADVLAPMRRMVRKYEMTPEEIRKIRQKGIFFQIHTVNRRKEMNRWLALGVDSILTDRPDLLAPAIAQRPVTGCE